jgi:hypothetical protein
MYTFVTVLSVKGQVKNGFFVEAGADDFERDSNTLYFEVTILSGFRDQSTVTFRRQIFTPFETPLIVKTFFNGLNRSGPH